jgi:quercetin dioxygenase-like cupin family protein
MAGTRKRLKRNQATWIRKNFIWRFGQVTMFCKQCDEGFREVLPGVSMKTLTFGKNMLFTEFRLKAGHSLPIHEHPQEQTGYLMSGSIRLTIGKDVHLVGPGDGWNIPGNVDHGAVVLEDSVAIEVFSPVRKDYLPKDVHPF